MESFFKKNHSLHLKMAHPQAQYSQFDEQSPAEKSAQRKRRIEVNARQERTRVHTTSAATLPLTLHMMTTNLDKQISFLQVLEEVYIDV
jgi:hypothetical protein